MEDSKLTPEENNSNELSPDITDENKNDKNEKAFIEVIDKSSNQGVIKEKVNLKLEEQSHNIDKSLFRRFLDNGFDGISTNPNHKMLALLIILFINLSLFFVIGNIGKAFLRNAGIMD